MEAGEEHKAWQVRLPSNYGRGRKLMILQYNQYAWTQQTMLPSQLSRVIHRLLESSLIEGVRVSSVLDRRVYIS